MRTDALRFSWAAVGLEVTPPERRSEKSEPWQVRRHRLAFKPTAPPPFLQPSSPTAVLQYCARADSARGGSRVGTTTPRVLRAATASGSRSAPLRKRGLRLRGPCPGTTTPRVLRVLAAAAAAAAETKMAPSKSGFCRRVKLVLGAPGGAGVRATRSPCRASGVRAGGGCGGYEGPPPGRC